MNLKKLPVGIDDFAKLRQQNFYYVDKTGMIRELLEDWGEVNLFARPRRFGKTLNMSMLQHFFEIDTDKTIFDGLEIRREKELCHKYMGRFPVITLSLKQVRGLHYRDAKRQMWSAISFEADRLSFLDKSDKLDEVDRKLLMDLRMERGNLKNAVLQLTRLLYKHYEKKVILLIDEYDVPLQKADEKGYYGEMVELISQIFGYSMKTNPYMEFAVVTGCLRIAKESIFTGFNNPKIHTIADEKYGEWFGFTDGEVRKILEYYGRSEYYEMTKEWYDGYLFGNTLVYCPWDVINWCDQLSSTSDSIPRNFWANTSGNDIIRRFADKADQKTRDQLGELIEGKSVWKKLNFQVTYNDLDSSIENLWSVMFMTGYLTQRRRDEEGRFELVLPNREVTSLFIDIVNKWFREKVLEDREGLEEFFASMDAGDAQALEDCINYTLEESISFLDGGGIDEKENFYHGLILGILSSRTGWISVSNREAGSGRLDVAAYPRRGKSAVIFEFKYVKEMKNLEKAAKEALIQITEKQYDSYFQSRTPEKIVHCGIAFCKKRCKVVMEHMVAECVRSINNISS